MKALCESPADSAGNGHTWDTQTSVAFPPLDQQERADTALFRRLMEQHERIVLKVAHGLLGDLADAHQAAERTFVALFRERLSSSEGLAVQILRRVLEQCAAQRRMRQFRKVVRRLKGNFASRGETMNANAPGSWEPKAVMNYLARSAYRHRELLVLREIAGQSVDDIASITRMPPATVRRELFTARQQLLAISQEGDLNCQWSSH